MTSPAAEHHPFRTPDESDRTQPVKIFCGHCGRSPQNQEGSETGARVCPRCGMGLLLQAPAKIAPAPSDPFLVVDASLTVCAVSRRAEQLLDISETEAVNRHIAEFLAPGDTEAPKAQTLAGLIAWAARGQEQTQDVVVRPTNTFGVRYWARVGPCGPPMAALLVLADAR
jgi:PAS domain-containing protein